MRPGGPGGPGGPTQTHRLPRSSITMEYKSKNPKETEEIYSIVCVSLPTLKLSTLWSTEEQGIKPSRIPTNFLGACN